MPQRAYNFNAGPAALPLEVLQQAQQEFIDYQELGMSVMEISHRSSAYEQINSEAQELMKELLGLPESYEVLFLQGGASAQFAMIPMNFLSEGKSASYVMTGSWSKKALQEAQRIGNADKAYEPQVYKQMPTKDELQYGRNAAYLHLTSNETIEGIQFQEYPDTGEVPLIADLSSDILCRPIPVEQFDMIYAGAQKNLGPSGVTVVIVKKDLLTQCQEHVPAIFDYRTHVKSQSLYNTPPVYSVYMVHLVLQWIKRGGGLGSMEAANREKADLIYRQIDQSGGFYIGNAEASSRSLMNITFRISDHELEKVFLSEAEEQGFVGLKGHRSVGGLRASTYNAVPYESCKALAEFMQYFRQQHQ